MNVDFNLVNETVLSVLGRSRIFSETESILDRTVGQLKGKVVLFHDTPYTFSDEGRDLMSYDFKKTFKLVTMWGGNLTDAIYRGLVKMTEFFAEDPNAQTGKGRGIIFDAFTLRTRKGVAEIFREQLANFLKKEPVNMKPGLVVLDHWDDRSSNILFGVFLKKAANL